MLIPNHPDDERLSALASREADATGDAALTAHVSTCDRCTGLVTELGALRAALAELPDLAPSRPLRLLPPVEASPATAADRLGGWARRFFAPVLASGAALALVGTIGTAAPALGPTAQSGAAPEEEVTRLQAPEAASAPSEPASSAGGVAGAAAASETPVGEVDTYTSDESRNTEGAVTPLFSDGGVTAEDQAEPSSGDGSIAGSSEADESAREAAITAERSPWPMVLFTGVAVMIAALLLRWILVPRTG